MAILSAYSATHWDILLSRTETDNEAAVAVGDITIAGTTVTQISGTGPWRHLTLNPAIATLTPSAVTIANHAGMCVEFAIPAESLPFLKQIRNILRIGITEEDLSDDTIASAAFLGKAEWEVYGVLNITPAAYDTKAAADAIYQQRVRTAVMYRTAALLVPAFPTILQNAIQQERVTYEEFDWQQRIALYLRTADEAIATDMPTDEVSGGVVVAELATRRTYF